MAPHRRLATFLSLSCTLCSSLTASFSISTIQARLDPVNEPSSLSWTTDPTLPNALPLDDETFRAHKIAQVSRYEYTKPPDDTISTPSTAMRVFFANNSVALDTDYPGGVSFYAPGPESVDLTLGKEVILSYKVLFQEGFEWVKGGKLPGLYGGGDDETAYSCSGGRRDTSCFSFRLMWRRQGEGEVYTYIPPYDLPEFAVNAQLCDLPGSRCDSVYGISVMRGAFNWKAYSGGQSGVDEWVDIAERVKLNDPGEANGEIELFVGGKSVILGKGIIIRDNDQGRVRGIQMQSFFGGSDATWASPQDQYVYFKDFGINITSTFE